MVSYVPSRGDVVWLNFQPQAGHEQSGRRPALVLSPQKYNAKTQLMLCCPITTQIKGYPFEVAIELRGQQAVILSDHVKSLDWNAREASFETTVAPAILKQCTQRLVKLLVE